AAARDSTAAGRPDRPDGDALLRGVELVRSQFLAKLESFGVTPIVAIGRSFDTRLHEAVATSKVSEAAQDGIIVAVVKTGFVIGDQLLRPATVVVGKFDGQA